MAERYASFGEYEKAIECVSRTLEMELFDPMLEREALLCRGLAYEKLGRLSEAVKDLERARAIHDDLEVFLALSRCRRIRLLPTIDTWLQENFGLCNLCAEL